jgi:hypothetical protein
MENELRRHSSCFGAEDNDTFFAEYGFTMTFFEVKKKMVASHHMSQSGETKMSIVGH